MSTPPGPERHRQPTVPFTPAEPSGGPGDPNVIFCPRCGRRNEATEIYCQVCAQPLHELRRCAQCSARIPGNAVFCPECGRRVGA